MIPFVLSFLTVAEKFEIAFLFISVVCLFSFFIVRLSDSLGIKRHTNFVNSEGFQKLLLRGFKVEKVNDYVGITGTYNDYICDIYYNWTTIINSKIGRAVVINIYFVPPKPLDKVNNANYDFIMAMKKKHRVSRWSFKSYDFDWREGAIVVKHRVGLKNPSYEIIDEMIKIGLEVLKEEGLKPISREDLTYIRNNFPYQSVPWISLYQKKKG